MASSGEGPSGVPAETVRVGYGLREKRAASFLAPELLALAKEKGVEFVKIDPSISLEDQGPFHLILHKLDVCPPRHAPCNPLQVLHCIPQMEPGRQGVSNPCARPAARRLLAQALTALHSLPFWHFARVAV